MRKIRSKANTYDSNRALEAAAYSSRPVQEARSQQQSHLLERSPWISNDNEQNARLNLSLRKLRSVTSPLARSKKPLNPSRQSNKSWTRVLKKRNDENETPTTVNF
jgi:hypothetical protein